MRRESKRSGMAQKAVLSGFAAILILSGVAISLSQHKNAAAQSMSEKLGLTSLFHQSAPHTTGLPRTLPEKELRLPGDPRNLTLTFDDEFDNPQHSFGPSGVWTPNFGSGRQMVDSHTLRGNAEQEVYVDPTFAGTGDKPLGLNPFKFRDRGLTISIERTPEAHLDKLWRLPFTSGMLSSVNSWRQKYGYFEIRTRLPKGKGLWPAFWLLPSDNTWPPELDIFEMLGHRPDIIYVSTHSIATGAHTHNTQPVDVSDTSSDFHVYGAMWDEKTVKWYVDRRLVATAPTPSDMNKPMYIVVTLGIGGSWPGNADATTPIPSKMDIDYVRAWQFKDAAHPAP